MNPNQPHRIVSIEARRSRFGYAVFEGPNKLIDWGASAIPSQLSGRAAFEAAKNRVVGALRRCHPEAAIVKQPRRTATGISSTPGPIFKTIVREAAALGLSVQIVARNEIREAFDAFRTHNKDDVADVLVRLFPELLARLPHRRNSKWKPEWRGMIVFDAVAAGFAYWKRMGMQMLPSEP